MKIYECLTHRDYEGMMCHYVTLDRLEAERWIEDHPDSWGEICVWLNGRIIEHVEYTWEYDISAKEVITTKEIIKVDE